MSKPELLQVGPYPEWDETPLHAAFQVYRYFEAEDPAAFLDQYGSEIRGIATRGELGASANMIAACPALEIISVYGVGYDAVDLDAARARGIRVTNTPDVLTADVADLGVAMMLARWRGMIGAEAWVRSGDWAARGLYSLKTRVHGKRAGVLGLGRIGYEVARRLAGFDMDIAYADIAPKGYAADWTFIADPTVLAERSDVLFVTLAASPATRHIVGAEVLEALGPEGLLINIPGPRTSTKTPFSRRSRRAVSAPPHSMCSRASPHSTLGFSRWTTCFCNRTMHPARSRPARPWANWSGTILPPISQAVTCSPLCSEAIMKASL